MPKVYVMVKIERGVVVGWLRHVAEEIKKIPGVTHVNGIFGRFDLIVEVEADSLEDVSNIVIDKIMHVHGVKSTESFTVIF